MQLEHDGAIISLKNGVITIKAATSITIDAPTLVVKGRIEAEGEL